MAKTVRDMLAWPLIQIVRLYRFAISPWLGANCRFEPTCSSYAIEALEIHGVLKGTCLAVKRIGRCHPWGGAGYDPVPGHEEGSSEAE
jgi:putative membrane protein insertion efficiency factor